MNYTTKRKTYVTAAKPTATTNTLGNLNPTATSDMILDQLNQRKLDKQQTSLNSAALQDHIMK